MLRMSTPQGPGFHSTHYHSTIGREKAAALNLGKERIGLAKTTDGISPYPSPPMSDGSNHHDRGSPNHQEEERSSHRSSMSSLPRVQYTEGYREVPTTSTSNSLQQSRSSILPPPLIHPTPVPASSIARTTHILSSSAPASNSPFSIQQQPASQIPQKKPKSHVPSACIHCKKAHLGCGVERPCQRCISLGKQETCVDVPHKKRGRPRLKESGTHSFEISRAADQFARPTQAISPRSVGGIPYNMPITPLSTHGMDNSYHPSQQSVPQPPPRQYVRPSSQRSRLDSLNPVAGLRETRSRTHSDPPRALLLAVLTPDLVFLQCSETARSIYDIDAGSMGRLELIHLAPNNRAEIEAVRGFLLHEMERRGRFQRLEVEEGLKVAVGRSHEEWSECTGTAVKYYFHLDLVENRQRSTRVHMMCAIVPARTDQYIAVVTFHAPPAPPSSQSASQYFSQYSPALPSPILSPPGGSSHMHRHSLPSEFPSVSSPGLSSPGISSYSLRTLPSPLAPRMGQTHPSTPSTPNFDISHDPTRPRTSPGFKLEQPPVPRSQQALAGSIQLPPIRFGGEWESLNVKTEEVTSGRSETGEDEKPRKRNRVAVSEIMNP